MIALIPALVLGSFVLTVAAAGFVLVRLPPDYFVRPRRSWRDAWRGSAGRKIGTVARNLAGIVLVAAGALLSVPGIPGQGLLTILLGLFLVDFSGKERLQRRLLRPRRLRRGVDRLRARFGRPAFQFPA